jgi:hypothetical protein
MGLYIKGVVLGYFYNDIYINNRKFSWRLNLYAYQDVNSTSGGGPGLYAILRRQQNLTGYKYIIIKNIVSMPSLLIASQYGATNIFHPISLIDSAISFFHSFSIGFHNAVSPTATGFNNNTTNLFLYPSSSNTSSKYISLSNFFLNCEISHVIDPSSALFSLIHTADSDYIDSIDYTSVINYLTLKYNLTRISRIYLFNAITIQGEII